MAVFDRVLGLLLALFFISVPVVSYDLWRRGHAASGAILLLAPITAVLTLTQLSPSWSVPQRFTMGAALAPFVLLPALTNLLWLASGSRISVLTGAANWVVTGVGRSPASSTTGRVLFAIGVVGLAWFLFEWRGVDAACPVGPANAPGVFSLQLLACAKSGFGTWPLALTSAWAIAAGRSRVAQKSDTANSASPDVRGDDGAEPFQSR
jgi:hypothetical protein